MLHCRQITERVLNRMSRDLKWKRYQVPANLPIKAARIPLTCNYTLPPSLHPIPPTLALLQFRAPRKKSAWSQVSIPRKTDCHTGFLNDLLLKSANVELKIKACKHNKFDSSPVLDSGNLRTSPLWIVTSGQLPWVKVHWKNNEESHITLGSLQTDPL